MKKVKFSLWLIMVLFCMAIASCSSESDENEEKRKDKATPAEAFDYVVYEGGVTIYGLVDESLTTIHIPEEIEGKAVRDIASRAFKGNDKLTSVVIEGMEYISDYAFVDCSALKEVVLPDGLEKLGNGVFQKCTSLTSVKIPDGVTDIGFQAFSHCGLESLEIPGGVTIFGTYAIDEDIVLHVEAGSYAEEWARFNGYTVVTRGGQ